MKNIFKSVLFLALIFNSYSCSDTFLDEFNPNGVSTDIFWSDLDETESSLTAVYGAMLHTYVHGIGADANRSDLGFPRNRTNPSGNNITFYYKTFNSGIRDVRFQWDGSYQVIFRANQVIEGLESLQGQANIDTERWTQQMAQARFFRGLVHFYLNNVFNKGDVIIRDRVPRSNEDFNKALSTSQEVIDFYRADLEYAYANLPAKYEDTPFNKGRATAGSAATILGTSYLYQGAYAEAMPYLNDVIDNRAYGYELVRDMSLLFTTAGEFNKESIFEVNYSLEAQLEVSQWDESSFNSRLARYTAPINRGGGGSDHFFPTAWLTKAYADEPLDDQDPRNFVADGAGGTKLRNVSLRASAMIALAQDEHTPYYGFASFPELCGLSSGSFSWFKKYTNHDINGREHDTGLTPWKSGRNVTLNRLAEVYLMRAECKIQTGDIAGALADMNKVRERWGLQFLGTNDGSTHSFDEVVYDAQSLMDHLMYIERPLELSIEGNSLRTTDLRRWGITKQRFQELAALEFYTEAYKFTDSKGEAGNCGASLLIEGTGGKKPIKEFQLAADNYIEDIHDYLPIPLSEVQNNSSIN